MATKPFTYTDDPGTEDADQRRDAVRYLTGDTDSDDVLASDAEIAFALGQAGNDVFRAAGIVARTLAADFGRLASISVDGIRATYEQQRDSYKALADAMEAESAKLGSEGLGLPRAGGLTESGMKAIDENTDRVTPAFRIRQFKNPPRRLANPYDLTYDL